ncbi:exonuclease domain-containing protein [Streptomyces sp. NPDC092296]|uniref:3'-5' exonuclease n=1 Tax=Streptomyces sp. NPDC092296 TaxID=3366012 RepID=UPI003803EE48
MAEHGHAGIGQPSRKAPELNETWPTRLFVVDVEGNGHAPPDLIEIAAVPVSGGQPGAAHQWLIRPPRPIQERVARIHGIHDADVAEAPTWGRVAGQVRELLDGAWIVAHSATVEYSALTRHLPGWQPAGVLDTLRLARATLPDAPGHGLDALIDHCAIDTRAIPGRRHRAAYDAIATALLLHHLARHYPTWTDMAAIAVPTGLPGAPQPTPTEDDGFGPFGVA